MTIELGVQGRLDCKGNGSCNDGCGHHEEHVVFCGRYANTNLCLWVLTGGVAITCPPNGFVPTSGAKRVLPPLGRAFSSSSPAHKSMLEEWLGVHLVLKDLRMEIIGLSSKGTIVSCSGHIHRPADDVRVGRNLGPMEHGFIIYADDHALNAQEIEIIGTVSRAAEPDDLESWVLKMHAERGVTFGKSAGRLLDQRPGPYESRW